MSSNSDNSFNKKIASRLLRFQYLLNFASLDKKPYQVSGVEFCLRNELKPDISVRGGIIADEMGLGKTIMMIGLMFSNILDRTLIVLPPILIQQWYGEIFKITGHRACIYHGTSKKKINIEGLQKSKIVLTTYNAIAISKKNKQLAPLHQVSWNRVIFDEAHHLRNKKTDIFLGCINIRATNKWFVTGTPIQNRKEDFYSLCYALGLLPAFYKNETNLAYIKETYILHRTKNHVGIQLPDIKETNCLVPWKNKKEKAISEDIHSLLECSHVSSSKRGAFGNYIVDDGPLIIVLRAKQSCIMPSLMKNILSENGVGVTDFSAGSKVDAVVEKIISRKENGSGKIIFCHYREEIDYISNKLMAAGLVVAILDGRIKGKKRAEQLKMKADVMILQIQTGCEGLNLQENYSEIYFVSPHWNPAVEDQAIARCHRIGQVKPVSIFRFIMSGFDKDPENISGRQPITLEKHIQSIQRAKRQIVKEILDP